MSTPQHVFISYARKDGTAYAARLDATLPQQGFNTWRDQRGIDPTQDFTAEIERAIENASYVVTCITPDVRRDDSFVRREIQFAQILKKPIIVARFRDVAPPISVINHTSIDFFRESWTTAFERLCGHLRQPPGEYQPLPPSKPPDIFEPYLSSLYQQIVRYLDKTVFSSLPHQSGTPLITLRSESRPEAVQGSLEIQAQKLTMAFFAMAGVSDSGITLPFEDIQQAYQHYQGRLLILGNPGAGKTTTLMAFARDCVAKRLDDVSAPLPIVAPVMLWNPDQGLGFSEWVTQLIPSRAAEVQTALENGELLLLLDGLDELGDAREGQNERGEKVTYDPRQVFVQQLPSKNRVILTCRNTDFDDLKLQLPLTGAITLQPLDDTQLQHYLKELPELWAILQSDEELREMIRTPLLLSLFAFAFAGLSEEAKHLQSLEGAELREAIFATYLHRRYEHEKRKPYAKLSYSLEELYQILSDAVTTQGQIDAPLRLQDITTHLGNSLEQGRALLHLASELSILIPTHDAYQFVHSQMRHHIILHPYLQKAKRSTTSQDWMALGRVQRLLRRSADSLVSLSHAIGLDAADATAWFEHGLTLELLERYEEASRSFQQATQQDGQSAQYWALWGESLLLLKNYEQSEAALNQAIALQPQQAEYWARRAQIFRVQGRYSEAIQDYQNSLELDPRYAWAWNGYGLALRALNRLQDALESYQRAAALDPHNGWFAVNAAFILMRQRRYEEALKLMETAIREAAHNPAVWTQQGRLLRRLGRFAEALVSYDHALALAPDYVWAWLGRGFCCGALRRYEEAVSSCSRASSLEPSHVGFLFHYALALYRNHQLKDAEAVFRRIFLVDPFHASAILYLRQVVAVQSYQDSGDHRFRNSRMVTADARTMFQSIAKSHVLSGAPNVSFIFEVDADPDPLPIDIAFQTNAELDALSDDIGLASQTHITSDRGEPYPPRSEPSVTPTEGEFQIGDRIEGRYEVAEIRHGGMGIVYLCYDHVSREPVAIKTFQSRFISNERVAARFAQEALVWIRLEQHPHIVSARLIQNILGRPHIIMEYIVGPEGIGSDLRGWIDAKRLSIPQAVEYALHIALGMQHATRKIPGLVHRDLKPSNIMVTYDGIAKVTDFGLVRAVELRDIALDGLDNTEAEGALERLTRVGAIVGTAPYLSPEQANSEDIDMRSDIYAFGCLFFEMVTQHSVFQAHSFKEYLDAHRNQAPVFSETEQASIPSIVQYLILACLEKERENRPASWDVLVEELQTLYAELYHRHYPLPLEPNAAQDPLRLLDKGASLASLGRYEEALESIDQARQLAPTLKPTGDLEHLFGVLDSLHDAASDGKLAEATQLSAAETVGWLREIIYTAQEVIDELDKNQPNS